MVSTDEGRLFVWGRGSFGRLGNGKAEECYTPVELQLPGTTSLSLHLPYTNPNVPCTRVTLCGLRLASISGCSLPLSCAVCVWPHSGWAWLSKQPAW